jgi:excisionase family DNA binding protein
MDTKKIYNTNEVSQWLGITNETVFRQIRDNKLRAFRLFKKWYILHSDLMEFIENEGKPNRAETNQTENQ